MHTTFHPRRHLLHILILFMHQYIAAFKRDLGNVAGSMVAGRELEEAVRVLYKKYVRGEKGLENSLKVRSLKRAAEQTPWGAVNIVTRLVE